MLLSQTQSFGGYSCTKYCKSGLLSRQNRGTNGQLKLCVLNTDEPTGSSDPDYQLFLAGAEGKPWRGSKIGLARRGQIPLPEYSEATYSASPPRWYEVRDGFPIIASNAIPEGVEDAKYSIRIVSCEPFSATPNWTDVMENLK